MNRQSLPQTPEIKRQGLLVNLSLIAYVCLFIGFLMCFIPKSLPYGIYANVVVHHNEVMTTVSSDSNVNRFYAVSPSEYHSNQSPDLDAMDQLSSSNNGAAVIHTRLDTTKTTALINLSSIDSTETTADGYKIVTFGGLTDGAETAAEGNKYISFGTIGGMSGNVETDENGNKYYQFVTIDPNAETDAEGNKVSGIGSILDSKADVAGDQFVSFGTTTDIRDATNIQVYISSIGGLDSYAQLMPVSPTTKLQSFLFSRQTSPVAYTLIQPDLCFVTSYAISPVSSTPLSYINTAMLFLSAFIPCILLLLYVWKLHENLRGKLLLPISFGAVAVYYAYDSICIIANFFQHGRFYASELLNLLLPVALAVCYVMMTIHSCTGSVSKKWLLITAIASALFCLEACLVFPNLLYRAPIWMKVIYGANILGHILFYVTLLLHAFFNMIPRKDDTPEDKEPIIESKNIAPAPERA